LTEHRSGASDHPKKAGITRPHPDSGVKVLKKKKKNTEEKKGIARPCPDGRVKS